jgi:glutamate-1-semialdehyde 2,1-aminomutase
MTMKMTKSQSINDRFHTIIPGGAHTYAKGDDQFPEHLAPYIVRGKGSHVWDMDGNEFIEYNSGVRAIGLGHAYPPLIEAATRQMEQGNNFVRPSPLELECAEALLEVANGAEMVKFGKNGSDATSAAVRLSRAVTGRNRVAICSSHPFFSVDDWFIGTTPMSAGIPRQTIDLIVAFTYNDLESARKLFEQYPGEIACVILEPEKETPPADGFLHKLQDLCHKNGAIFILDEMINGFRWAVGGGQRFHNIVPDLSTFGKALGNGFSIAALVGKRELMERGGFRHKQERVFLLSLTHGAEYPNLAVAKEVMRIYKSEPVIKTLWERGEQLSKGVSKCIEDLRLDGHFAVLGRPCCLVYGTRDQEKKPSQTFRTLFLQETIKRGLLAPSFVVNYSHSEADIQRTVDAVHGALQVYRKALDEGVEKYLVGRSVQPAFRRYS